MGFLVWAIVYMSGVICGFLLGNWVAGLDAARSNEKVT